ncbi:SELENOP [Branchiostoma lanceolatum]|uniref:SELENOP protein n=1 Tax=Branchiostoma lanceolatum TaxID=7740 RepID=A0A8J9YXY0_BRALA|nr:SELENOP [Branchiostoma lanceolatum]
MSGLLQTAALCLVVSWLGSLTCAQETCGPPAYWEVEGRSPMAENKGKVVVMNLEALRQKLYSEGKTDIFFGAVNHWGWASWWYKSELERRANFPIYQVQKKPHPITLVNQDPISLYVTSVAKEALDSWSQDIWGKLHAAKDDILVYDRCGRLAYHLRLPRAYLGNSHTEEAIRAAYRQSPCGPCGTLAGETATPWYNKYL